MPGHLAGTNLGLADGFFLPAATAEGSEAVARPDAPKSMSSPTISVASLAATTFSVASGTRCRARRFRRAMFSALQVIAVRTAKDCVEASSMAAVGDEVLGVDIYDGGLTAARTGGHALMRPTVQTWQMEDGHGRGSVDRMDLINLEWNGDGFDLSDLT